MKKIKKVPCLNIYVILEILSFFDLKYNGFNFALYYQLDKTDKSQYSRIILKDVTDLYFKWGHVYKKIFFAWKTSSVVINRTQSWKGYSKKDKKIIKFLKKNCNVVNL